MDSDLWFEDEHGTRLKKAAITDVNGEEVLAYTTDWKSYLARLRVYQGFLKANLSPDLEQLTLDSYKGEDDPKNLTKLKRYINEFDSLFSRASVYLWSRLNSTQKTTTAKLIAKELLLKGRSVYFTTFSDLVTALKDEAFRENAALLVQLCHEVDFLILDDAFDPRKVTIYKSGFQLAFIDTFLRKRLETNQKATCLTANVPLDEIGKVFGISLQALLERTCKPFEFNDPYPSIDLESLWS